MCGDLDTGDPDGKSIRPGRWPGAERACVMYVKRFRVTLDSDGVTPPVAYLFGVFTSGQATYTLYGETVDGSARASGHYGWEMARALGFPCCYIHSDNLGDEVLWGEKL